MKIVAVVPIKLNNERLPNKNTRLLGDKPLLRYCLDTLLEIGTLHAVYVYCSNRAILPFLPKAVTFLKRSPRLDLPTAKVGDIFDEFIHDVNADIYVHAHATAPFLTAATIRSEINAVSSGGYDSAFSAEKIQDFLWRGSSPVNFDASNIPRSQDLPVLWRETSGAYVFKKEVFMDYHRRVGYNPFIAEVGRREAVDINTADDFRYAEIMLNSKG